MGPIQPSSSRSFIGDPSSPPPAPTHRPTAEASTKASFDSLSVGANVWPDHKLTKRVMRPSNVSGRVRTRGCRIEATYSAANRAKAWVDASLRLQHVRRREGGVGRAAQRWERLSPRSTLNAATGKQLLRRLPPFSRVGGRAALCRTPARRRAARTQASTHDRGRVWPPPRRRDRRLCLETDGPD